MGVGFRVYVFEDGGSARRISQRVTEGLISGDDTISELEFEGDAEWLTALTSALAIQREGFRVHNRHHHQPAAR